MAEQAMAAFRCDPEPHHWVELKARLDAVLALCADLCVCDFEREHDYTECDACKIRAAARGGTGG